MNESIVQKSDTMGKSGNVNYVPDYVLTTSDLQEVVTYFTNIKKQL